MAQDVKPTPVGPRHLAFVVVTLGLVAAGWFIFYNPGWTPPLVESVPAAGTSEVN